MNGNCDHLFVYGTLRQVSQAPMSRVLASHSEYLDEGFIQGKLYDVGEYPAAILSTNKEHRVLGEIYKINNNGLLKELDDYEGCSEAESAPHEYKRVKVEVKMSNKLRINAWMYAFNKPVKDLYLIESGDYMSYLGISLPS